MDRKTKSTSRRNFLGHSAGAAMILAMGGVLGARRVSAGGHLPKLDPNDSTAKALAYTHKSTTDGQWCKNCQLFQGGEKTWGACAIFPGKEVSAQGWCKSWVKKTT